MKGIQENRILMMIGENAASLTIRDDVGAKRRKMFTLGPFGRTVA
jgi:hypothetical protein